MEWFKKRRDPISEKARALEEQIHSLEEEIKTLSEEVARPQPRFRSSAVPGSHSRFAPPQVEEKFEKVERLPLNAPAQAAAQEPPNDLGVRKSNLVAVWGRVKNHFKGPAASNPKLVNYLAAGSIQGLRPLRYEKRVARNRFIFLVVILLLVLWGILAVMFRR